MSTTASIPCPECGRPVPPGAAMGLCPRCVVRMVLEDPASPIATDAPAVPADLPHGFADYDILEEIGRGGMGVVYKVRQRSLSRLVALKMMLGGQFAGAKTVARFRVEAETTAHLQHPNIVAIHEVGEQEGLPYLTMDYVPGRNLAELVQDQPLPARRAALYLETMAGAIQYAHEQGVLHRDLKPSNVLIDGLDEPRITDFGLAKRLGDTTGDLTLSGQALGSPNFMPPEQAAGRHQQIGPASDVYGLGATLYYMVTGRPPFVGENIAATAKQVLENEPVAPRLLNPRLPRDLETICLRCLMKDPGRRYGTAREVMEELGRFLRGEPIQARPVGVWGRSWRWCRRKPGLAAALAVVVALAVAASATALRLAAVGVRQEREFYYASIAQAQGLIEQGNIARAREILLRCPENHRQWEWGHLMALCHGDIVSIPAHTNILSPGEVLILQAPVKGLSFDRSGARLGTLGQNGVLKVWELDSGKLLWSRGNLTNTVGSMLFDPARDRVALVESHRMVVCSSITGRELEPVVETGGAVLAMAWSTNGQVRAVVKRAREIGGLELDSGRPAEVTDLKLPPADRVRFTPDGEGFVMATANVRELVRWPDGKVLRRFELDAQQEAALTLDPSGQSGASIDIQGSVYIHAPDGHRSKVMVDSMNFPSLWIQFSPDGRKFCICGPQRSACLVDTQTSQVLLTFPARVESAVFSSDNSHLVALDKTLQATLYDLRSFQAIRTLRGHDDLVDRAAFSPDGRYVASADMAGVVKIWSARGGREVMDTKGWGWAGTYSPDGRKLSYAGSGAGLYVCDALSGRRLLHLHRERLVFLYAAFSPDQRHLATDDYRGEVWIWDLKSGEHVTTLRGLEQSPFGLAYSPDGRLLAAGSLDRTARIWDAQTGALRHTLRGHSFWVTGLDFSPDGRWLATAGKDDPHVGLWDVESGQRVGWWKADSGGVWRVRYSPDGRFLATSGQDEGIRLWEVPSGRFVREMAMRGNCWALDFSPDGRRLVCWLSKGLVGGQDIPSLQLWDTQEGRQVLDLQGHRDLGTSVEFHPQGLRLLSCGIDTTLRQWEAFPWRNTDYPASQPGEPLGDRIRRHATVYWRERLAAEAQADQPDRKADHSVFMPFDRSTLPPRDPATPPELLDLTDHYTGRLDGFDLNQYTVVAMNDHLIDLPHGRVRLGETEFDIRGVLRLREASLRYGPKLVSASQFPERTQPITVGRLVNRLHCLGGLIFLDASSEGAAVARVAWQYTDGSQRETPVIYGRHLRHWWTIRDPKDSVSAGRVAWTGSNPSARDFNSKIRLFHFTLDNPRPESEVASLQWIGVLRTAAPFIVALTVE